MKRRRLESYTRRGARTVTRRIRSEPVRQSVNETKEINVARLRYKAAFDAYWTIAKRNAELIKNGGHLTTLERSDEERAAVDLKAARDELTASTSANRITRAKT